MSGGVCVCVCVVSEVSSCIHFNGLNWRSNRNCYCWWTEHIKRQWKKVKSLIKVVGRNKNDESINFDEMNNDSRRGAAFIHRSDENEKLDDVRLPCVSVSVYCCSRCHPAFTLCISYSIKVHHLVTHTQTLAPRTPSQKNEERKTTFIQRPSITHNDDSNFHKRNLITFYFMRSHRP